MYLVSNTSLINVILVSIIILVIAQRNMFDYYDLTESSDSINLLFSLRAFKIEKFDHLLLF